MPTLVLPRRRNRFYREADGVDAIVVRDNEVTPLTLDYTQRLETGETITASTWAPNGTSLSGAAFTTTTTSVTVTNSYGCPTNTVTTSLGRVLNTEVRVKSQHGRNWRDYGS
jgi:hypothetical protein